MSEADRAFDEIICEEHDAGRGTPCFVFGDIFRDPRDEEYAQMFADNLAVCLKRIDMLRQKEGADL